MTDPSSLSTATPQGASCHAALEECAQRVTGVLRTTLTAAFADCRDQLFDVASRSRDAAEHGRTLAMLRSLNAYQGAVIERVTRAVHFALLDLARDQQIRTLAVAERGAGPGSGWPDVAGRIERLAEEAATGHADLLRRSDERLRELAGRGGEEPIANPLQPRLLLREFVAACEPIQAGLDLQTVLLAGFHGAVLERLERILATIPGMPARNSAAQEPGPESGLERCDDVDRLVARLRSGGLKVPQAEPAPGPDAVPMVREPAAGGRRHLLAWTLATALAVIVAYLGGAGLAARDGGDPAPLSPSSSAESAAEAAAPVSVADPSLRYPVDAAGLDPDARPGDDNREVVVAAPAAGSTAPDAEATAGGPPSVVPAVADTTVLAAQIDGLLEGADAALARQQLTEPLAGSAYAQYRAVLTLDPDNAAALAGMAGIVDRYAAMIRLALERDEIDRADRYLGRALLVDPQAPRLLDLEGEIETRRVTARRGAVVRTLLDRVAGLQASGEFEDLVRAVGIYFQARDLAPADPAILRVQPVLQERLQAAADGAQLDGSEETARRARELAARLTAG